MGERGKVWRKVWAEAKDLGKKLIFPTLAGVAAAITPLEDKLKAEEKDSRPVVYLPEAKIDSAFAWQYGKVQEVDTIVIKKVEEEFRRVNWHDHIFVDVGDGWVVRVCGNGIGFYRDGKSVGGFSAGDTWDEVIAELKSDRVRIIKYTDEYGNNLLIVKPSDKDMAIYDSRISTNDPRTGFGLIMARGGYRIGRIGVAKVEDEIYGKGVAVIVEIIGDGIVGIAVFPDKQLITDETRIVAIR